jgi:hypothetical protein
MSNLQSMTKVMVQPGVGHFPHHLQQHGGGGEAALLQAGAS